MLAKELSTKAALNALQQQARHPFLGARLAGLHIGDFIEVSLINLFKEAGSNVACLAAASEEQGAVLLGVGHEVNG